MMGRLFGSSTFTIERLLPFQFLRISGNWFFTIQIYQRWRLDLIRSLLEFTREQFGSLCRLEQDTLSSQETTNYMEDLFEGDLTERPESPGQFFSTKDARCKPGASQAGDWRPVDQSCHLSAHDNQLHYHHGGALRPSTQVGLGMNNLEFAARDATQLDPNVSHRASQVLSQSFAFSQDTKKMMENMQNTARIYQQHMFQSTPTATVYEPRLFVPQMLDSLPVSTNNASRDHFSTESLVTRFGAEQHPSWNGRYRQSVQSTPPHAMHLGPLSLDFTEQPATAVTDVEIAESQFRMAIDMIKSKHTRKALHKVDPALSRRELFQIYRKVVYNESSSTDIDRADTPTSAYVSNELEEVFSNDYEDDASPCEQSTPTIYRRLPSSHPAKPSEWLSSPQGLDSHDRASSVESTHQSLLQAKPYLSDIAPEHTQGHHPSTIPKSPVRCVSRTSSLSVELRPRSHGRTPDLPAREEETTTPILENACMNVHTLPSAECSEVRRLSPPFKPSTKQARSVQNCLSGPLHHTLDPTNIPSAKVVRRSPTISPSLAVLRPNIPLLRLGSDSVYSSTEQMGGLPLERGTQPIILSRSASPSPVPCRGRSNRNSLHLLDASLPCDHKVYGHNDGVAVHGLSTNYTLTADANNLSHSKPHGTTSLWIPLQNVAGAQRHSLDPFLTGRDEIMFPLPTETPPLSPLTGIASQIRQAKRGQRNATPTVRSASRKATRKPIRNRAVSARSPSKHSVKPPTTEKETQPANQGLQNDDAKVKKTRVKRSRRPTPVAPKTKQATSDFPPVPSLPEIVEADTLPAEDASHQRLATPEALTTIESEFHDFHSQSSTGLCNPSQETKAKTADSRTAVNCFRTPQRKKASSTQLTPDAAWKRECIPIRRSPRLARK